MVNNGEKGSFWQRHKDLADNVIKAGCIVLTLKLTKLAVDVFQLWCVSFYIFVTAVQQLAGYKSEV